ncbi:MULTISPECIES: hypothetical protein [unclassified Nonomuraea]|uniref:hypothetical protein n=1 Tax=unclassified Nonomuraea TaxID=2593643 RepID=UPI00191C3D66|nr:MULTISPECIES: hypothetical protein [unclassified Nonomuraea]
MNEADANLAKIPDSVPDEMTVYCADMLSTGFMGAENGNIPSAGRWPCSPRARRASWVA